MKALVLSGGKGTRLQPLTHKHAKQLLPIANKPVLFYALEAIVATGITEIGLIVGETGAEVRAAVGDGSRFGPGVSITCIQQDQPLGLAHAVKIARPFLGDDRFLLFLGDNFVEENLAESVARFASDTCPYQAQLFLTPVENPQQFGVAAFDQADGTPLVLPDNWQDATVRLVRVVEKPALPPSNLAIVGLYLFDQHIFTAIDRIVPSSRGELEITDAIQALLDMGYTVHPHLLRGSWIDTGNAQDMLNANRFVLSRTHGSIASEVSIDASSRIEGEVTLGEHVCLINSVVYGPAMIGSHVTLINAYVGPFTSIDRNSSIINSGIEQSIVLEGCSIRDIEGRIEDSLIGRYAQITPSSSQPEAHILLPGDHSCIGLKSAEIRAKIKEYEHVKTLNHSSIF
jgi:glucose-1-phosphate thymidylyltransferase